jgi:maleate cis-trans isomerase
MEKFLFSLEASFLHTEGLMITSEDDILIDNMQGVVTLHTSRASKISLHTVESARMIINAPHAHVSLNLKSIHDLSYIHCASAEIIIGEGFDKCHIYD